MRWAEFVFSEKREVRLFRHIIFWAIWWLYISFTYNWFYWQSLRRSARTPPSEQPAFILLGSHLLEKTFLLIVVYAFFYYVFIHLLLPRFKKISWLAALVSSFLLYCALIGVAYYLYWDIFPFIDSLFGAYQPNNYASRLWPAIWLGLIESLKVFAAAATIKYVKYWWLKQKEKQKMEREKLNTELQLLKAQIHPDFLFNTLKHIRENTINASPRAPESLLKLSDLLSYMLYECDKPQVALDKEITMMKTYMEMEKLRLGESFEMGINIQGDLTNKMIAPFLLFPFIENSFKHSSTLNGNAWMIMDIGMEKNSFFMKLANGMAPDTNKLEEPASSGLSDAQKRLTLIYPQHELRLYQEQEMLITYLKIQLNDRTIFAGKEKEEAVMEE